MIVGPEELFAAVPEQKLFLYVLLRIVQRGDIADMIGLTAGFR